ncbi:MAG: heavy-metal-associated domain-containing protein [Firmicutes bacterium]|jgi:copper chaperone CopZ|nr:heavy-metal-associated domain-containing protein [Bacillota bacterium]
MKKIMHLQGLSCGHCQRRVEQALNAIPGVTARADLTNQQAAVTMSAAVDDQTLRSAVEEAGYQVISIEEIG